jgi:hypothetical protein
MVNSNAKEAHIFTCCTFHGVVRSCLKWDVVYVPLYFLVTPSELKISLTEPVGNTSHQGYTIRLSQKLGRLSHKLRKASPLLGYCNFSC